MISIPAFVAIMVLELALILTVCGLIIWNQWRRIQRLQGHVRNQLEEKRNLRTDLGMLKKFFDDEIERSQPDSDLLSNLPEQSLKSVALRRAVLSAERKALEYPIGSPRYKAVLMREFAHIIQMFEEDEAKQRQLNAELEQKLARYQQRLAELEQRSSQTHQPNADTGRRLASRCESVSGHCNHMIVEQHRFAKHLQSQRETLGVFQQSLSDGPSRADFEAMLGALPSAPK